MRRFIILGLLGILFLFIKAENPRKYFLKCVDRVNIDNDIIALPGNYISVLIKFTEPMDADREVSGRLVLPGSSDLILTGGSWMNGGTLWRFKPVKLNTIAGMGRLYISGAKTRETELMMQEENVPVCVGVQPIIERVKKMGEWMMKNPNSHLFVEGYNLRTLLGLYEITGEQKYLDYVKKSVSIMISAQKPEGYWGTGYGDVYFADTASALAILINYYKYASSSEKRDIDTALNKYINLLLVTGDDKGQPFVHKGGSVGVGFSTDKQGGITSSLNKPYTIATALTGAEIFAAMYYLTGNDSYKGISIKACEWIFNAMDISGRIPTYSYQGEHWESFRKDIDFIWRWPYNSAAYAGEGFIAAWTYIDDPDFRRELEQRVRTNIEWILRTQNRDGSWSDYGSQQQLRSHGVVNLLVWYYHNVFKDPRIAHALQRYYLLLLDEPRSKYLRIPGDYQVPVKSVGTIGTAIAGRALVDIIKPGVDCNRWKEKE